MKKLEGLHIFALLAFLITLLVPQDGQTLEVTAKEYELKVAYLYNFLNFVEFPSNSTKDNKIQICVSQAEKLHEAFDILNGEEADSKTIEVRHLKNIIELAECDVLFIPRERSNLVEPAIESAKGKAILTVSEIPQFCERGGMLNFFTKDKRLRFEVNVKQAEEENIQFRSKLLKRAVIVDQE